MIRLDRRDWIVAAWVCGFFLCCYTRVLATGYLELDDLGRVQIGYNEFTADGRLLTAGLMTLFSFGGKLVDVSPLPQLCAIATMGAAGVLLSRSLPGVARPVLAATLLFGTPFALQNMSYVFDSLSMALAVLAGLAAALLTERGRVATGIAALLASLLLYQPALNVFLCFASAAVLCALATGSKTALALVGRCALVLVAAVAIDGLTILLLKASGLVAFPAYQAQHAALLRMGDLIPHLSGNMRDMTGLLAWMAPLDGPYGLGSLVLVIGCLGTVLARLRGSRLALGLVAGLVLLSGFAGPMLLLRDPVVQPRVLLGVGGMLSASAWMALRLWPAGRAVPLVALLLAVCFARDAFAYGNLLRDLDRYEASVLPPIAQAIDREHASTGLGALQIIGAMPFPPSVRHGLARAPGLAPLFDNPLDGISWFGVALLAEYGLEDGIWFRDADPAAVPCATYRETGPGYSVGHDSRSLILIFRAGCP